MFPIMFHCFQNILQLQKGEGGATEEIREAACWDIKENIERKGEAK